MLELIAIAAVVLLLKKQQQQDALPPAPPPPPLNRDGGGGDRGGSAGTADAGKILGTAAGLVPVVIGGVKAIGVAAGVGGGAAAASASAPTAAVGVGAAGAAAAPEAAAGSSALVAEGAVVGLSAAEGVAGLVYLAFVVALLSGLFVAARRQRWTDWYGGIHKGPDGMRNRYRALMVDWETQANEQVAKRLPEGVNVERRWDEDAKTYVLGIPTVASKFQTLAAGFVPRTLAGGRVLGTTPATPPREPLAGWLQVCAVHRLYAVERLARWNAVLFSFYRSRGWTVDELEQEGIAMTEGAFWSFVADELAAQRNADFLGYKLEEGTLAQLQAYYRYDDVQKGARWSQLTGEAYAITRAAVDGWGAFWPGDYQFADELRSRCNLTWIHIGDGGVLQHPQLPVFIDVIASRQQESPLLIDMRTPQERAGLK